MSKTFRNNIERLALQILVDLNMLSFPIDVRALAGKSNIDVVYPELSDETSGALVRKNGKAHIICNKNHGYYRQRFTIAHELGHHFLNHQGRNTFVDSNESQTNFLFRDFNSTTGDVAQEVEANAFAAALLMPAKLLREEIEKLRTSQEFAKISDIDEKEEKMIKTLAKKFNVSKIAMTYRIGKLNLTNEMV